MAALGSPVARGTLSTCGRMPIGQSGPTGSCTEFTSACFGISRIWRRATNRPDDGVASVAGSDLFRIGWKLALTGLVGLPYLPAPRRGHASTKRQVVVSNRNKFWTAVA